MSILDTSINRAHFYLKSNHLLLLNHLTRRHLSRAEQVFHDSSSLNLLPIYGKFPDKKWLDIENV